jgi:photosystem II stability/assembly factor-like uncharacterized protein
MRLTLFLIAALGIAAAQSISPANQVWQMESSGTSAGLRGIDSVDGTVAWASGTGGTVLKTTDGGQHWQKCAIPDGDKDGATLDFRGVQAWDATTAIVMASGPGEKSRLYKTTDGCKSWTLLLANPDKDGFWDSISVADRLNFMILGDPVNGQFSIFDTQDGGKSWDKARDDGLRSENKEGAFAASNSSMLVNWVDGSAGFGTGGPSGAQLFIECDTCKKGVQWASHPMPTFPHGDADGIFSLRYRDWRRWIAVGGDYTKPNDSTGTAAWSSDGGKTWTAPSNPPHGYRSTVQYSDSLKLWITAGTNGSDISRDDGKTWRPLDNGNWNALSLPFIVGPQGRIGRLNPQALPKP